MNGFEAIGRIDNKKLCYREEHSAFVVLSWCTVYDIYRETINRSTANQLLLRNWPRN